MEYGPRIYVATKEHVVENHTLVKFEIAEDYSLVETRHDLKHSVNLTKKGYSGENHALCWPSQSTDLNKKGKLRYMH